MKYRLNPREMLRAEPEGFPEGSGDISSYRYPDSSHNVVILNYLY